MKKVFMKKIVSFVLAMLLCGIPAGLHAVEEESIAPEDKISEDLYKKFEQLKADGKNLSKEKIPVWVWYEDIDQKQVDREVMEQTGLTTETIAVNFEMPDLKLINDLKNNHVGSQERMQDYFARTVVARKLEAQKTKEYVDKRRQISKTKYKMRRDKIINEFILKNDDIIFKSDYSPSFISKMTQRQIVNLSKNKNIQKVYLYQETETIPCADTVADSKFKETVQVDKVFNNIALSGSNVKVGLADVGKADKNNSELTSSNIIQLGNAGIDDHSTLMARIICGNYGIAPSCTLYSTNFNFTEIENLITNGIQILSISIVWPSVVGGYSSYDKWFDHLVSQHSLTISTAAGNGAATEPRVAAPAMANNVITVGAYDDKGTAVNKSDDLLNATSRYAQETGVLKPDVIEPRCISNGGTSSATAVNSGIAALLLELKPSLSYQPQTLKAILMASCQRKVQSPVGAAAETMEQGLTERQGAGAVDAWNAVCIVSQGNYGYGEVKDAAEKRNFVQPAYGASHMNVSIAWLRENTISSSDHASGAVTSGTQHNLNLYVYRNGVQVGSSTNANSSTEMAYFPLSASEARYQIKVSNYNHASTETVRYGYAWCTDNMAFHENLTGTGYPDGIFYIRSKSNANGAYLTVDEETGQISQEAFTGEANQQWVSSKTGYDPFTIQTNSSAYPGCLSISGQTNAWVSQDSAQYITFGGSSIDNTYGIQLYGLPASNSRSLTALDTSAQSSAAIWQNIGIPERFQWYFEPVGYIRGDVNRDGTVSTADALLAQKYVSKLVTFDAAQRFLGDMNNDGQVNMNDVNLIQQAVAAG